MRTMRRFNTLGLRFAVPIIVAVAVVSILFWGNMLCITDHLPAERVEKSDGSYFCLEAVIYQEFLETFQEASLVTGSLMMLVIFLCLVYLYRLVARPLSHLVQAAQHDASPDYEGIEEFEILSDHFRQMRNRIQQTTIALEECLREKSDHVSRCQNVQMELQLANEVLEHSLEGIMITDVKGKIIKVNPAFTAVTGYAAEECLGQNPRMLKSGIQDTDFYQAMWKALTTTGRWENEIWNRRKNGEAYPQWLSISAIRTANGKPSYYVAVFHDMSDIKQNQEQMTYQAYHDALTGLPNRQLLRDHLEMALAQAQRHTARVGVLLLDLDHFKNVNDALGHAIGDLLLQEVAKRLKRCCRTVDTVARLGGDEFMIILPELKGEGQDAVEVSQRILRSFSEPFLIKQHEIMSSVSIGMTLYPADGEDVSTLIKNADVAMYKAKEQGRNTYLSYTKGMYENVIERVELENDLRKALKREEFKLYYQPQVNLKTGAITGMEALLRWQRSPHEIVSPDKFISLAEETGLIIPLGEWVLRTACKQTKVWHEAGFTTLSVSVNLSAKQFQDPQLVQVVQKILCETGLDADSLCLEITENTLMKDIDAAVKMMADLEQLGVHFSIDDFGTGYSSLNYLKRFPLSEIKIDKSFVRDLPRAQDDAAIARAILSLARSLNLKVLAEGVENETQLEFMRLNSCDGIQGYLFSKPIQPDELTQLLQENKRLQIA
ncbi:EAL domain-containing protein [candidate division KSB3 bacterium]|uniref:EAL domain-containing protein n=1 Tax=candidate division KSB3 bacterium TaxID=2044937 RepID=A0A9D5JT43_9BACT|nr:EAL domain-containing protein [candidate division KSB3 bacterium]MBD3323690.1 EAL domain-containing protein [candidate division KSB3 bacterium]